MPTRAYLALIDPELDNIRAALDWALAEKHDVELGAALTSNMYDYWSWEGYDAEGRARVDAALALGGEISSKQTIARLWTGLYRVQSLAVVSWPKAREYAERALLLYRELDDIAGIQSSLVQIGEACLRQFRHEEAQRYLDEALVLAEKMGYQNRIAGVKSAMARNLHFGGRVADARSLYAEALAIARAVGNDRVRSTVVGNLAEIEFSMGDAARAVELALENLEITTARSYISYNNLAAYLLALGRFEEGRRRAREGLRIARDAQAPSHVAISIMNLARVGAEQGDPQLAARLLGYTEETFGRNNFSIESTEQVSLDALEKAIRSAIGDDEFARLRAVGARMNEDVAVEEALRI